jgi:hypothetical protein
MGSKTAQNWVKTGSFDPCCRGSLDPKKRQKMAIFWWFWHFLDPRTPIKRVSRRKRGPKRVQKRVFGKKTSQTKGGIHEIAFLASDHWQKTGVFSGFFRKFWDFGGPGGFLGTPPPKSGFGGPKTGFEGVPWKGGQKRSFWPRFFGSNEPKNDLSSNLHLQHCIVPKWYICCNLFAQCNGPRFGNGNLRLNSGNFALFLASITAKMAVTRGSILDHFPSYSRDSL